MAANLAAPTPTLSSSPRSRSRESARSSGAGTPLPAAKEAEVPLPGFLRQSRLEIHNKFIDLEWQQRNRLAQGSQASDPPSQWARVSGDDVVKRNRYFNVDPFINNRVRLKVPQGHSDYINASPIALKTTKAAVDKSFIATQGPKEGSHSHIWRMIWHETTDPAVIVMLTQTHESGKEKCFQYFPASLSEPTLSINENDEFGDGFTATLTLLNITEDEATRSTIREMELKTSDGSTKKVWHLLFGGWPDFLIPEGTDKVALLRLVRLSSSLQGSENPGLVITESAEPAQNPRVVHCSAGVGRSGTFIALDYLLAQLDEGTLDSVAEDEDPIADLVDDLRQQRMMMVQGEQQFWFLYDVMKELWIARWKSRNGTGQGDSEGGAVAALEPESDLDKERQEEARRRNALEAEMRENAEKL